MFLFSLVVVLLAKVPCTNSCSKETCPVEDGWSTKMAFVTGVVFVNLLLLLRVCTKQ